VPDADDFPVTVKDTYGDPAYIDVSGGEVSLTFLDPSARPLLFDAETFEEFSQALIAARHVADRQEASDG